VIYPHQIFDKIWGFNSETTTNVIEVYASGLRKELKKIGYVRDGLIPSVDGSVLYEITEPRIRYLISRGLTAIE